MEIFPASTDAEMESAGGSSAVGGSFNVDIDVLGIANTIANAVKTNQNRPGWVKNVMLTTFYGANQQYNVMVFNLNQNFDQHFNGIKFYGSAVYDGITFGIWAFEDGDFTNQGDGGWINWAFSGWFDRNGGHVAFRKP